MPYREHGIFKRKTTNQLTTPLKMTIFSLIKAVEYLAQNNFEVEDGLERIIWLRRGAGDVIRLIEVNRNGFPTGRIEAFYFAPSEDVPFETYLADITPKEWQQVLSGEIPLPEGWSLEDSREFLRSEFEVEHVG